MKKELHKIDSFKMEKEQLEADLSSLKKELSETDLLKSKKTQSEIDLLKSKIKKLQSDLSKVKKELLEANLLKLKSSFVTLEKEQATAESFIKESAIAYYLYEQVIKSFAKQDDISYQKIITTLFNHFKLLYPETEYSDVQIPLIRTMIPLVRSKRTAI